MEVELVAPRSARRRTRPLGTPPISTLRAGTRCLGAIGFDQSRLAREVQAVLALELYPCDDAVGDWRLRTLWKSYGAEAEPGEAEMRRLLPYIDQRIAETFQTRHITLVRVFTASHGGFIRPHRDWTRLQRVFTRFHIPLQTNDRAFNSEGDVVFHMRAGEIWFLDGALPHSGGCFAEATRVHLVIDFDPSVPMEALFTAGVPRDPRRPVSIERAPFTDDDLRAVRELGAIASEANLDAIANLLGALHFERAVSCAATYDWLLEIARGAGGARVMERAQKLKNAYIGSPAELEGMLA